MCTKACALKSNRCRSPSEPLPPLFFIVFFGTAMVSASLHHPLGETEGAQRRIKLIGLFIELSGLYGCRRMCQRKGRKKKKRRAALIKTALRHRDALCPSPSRRLRRPQAPSARCYGEHCCGSTSTEISAPTQVSAPRSTRTKFSPLF